MENKFTILIVDPKIVNNNFTQDDKIIDNIIEKINDAQIKIVETDDINFTSDIVEGLELKDNKIPINTTIIREDEDKIWQMCYIETNIHKNHIASFLTCDKRTIYDNCVFFCSKINGKGSCDNTSMSIDDILQLLKKQKTVIGCTITVNKQIEEFQYNSLQIKTKIKEVDIFGFQLQIFYDDDKLVNRYASVLCNTKIYGNVNVISKTHDLNFVDITRATLLRILNTLKLPLEYRSIVEEKDEKDERGLMIIKNRWWNLRKKEQEKKINKCWNCDTNIELRTCGGCYRLLYCSKKCQTKDWKTHQYDCNMFMNRK